MRQIWNVALLALLVSGCGDGGGEDFTVKVKRPVAIVFTPFSQVDTGEAGRIFSGLQVNKSRPSDHELLYTIPGTGTFETTLRLTFEPAGNGAATIIHVAIDIPPVRAKIDGVDKVLSEQKIEAAMKELLKSTGESLEVGVTGNSASKGFSELLTGVAIATNSKFMDRIIEFKNDPEKMAAAMAALGGYDDYSPMDRPESPRGDPPEAMEPNDDARQAEIEQSSAEREMEYDARQASVPDDSHGY